MAGHGSRDGDHGVVFLCVEASDLLLEPMCSTWELQQELVPYVLSNSLQNKAFLKLSKAERQTRVKILTQKILSGESGAATGEASESEAQDSPAGRDRTDDLSPHRFWAHLRAKYGTRLGYIMEMLKLLEPLLKPRRVVVLRFEGDAAFPTASLLVRASASCSDARVSNDAWQREFDAGSFSTAGLSAWLQEVPSATRVPPLWSRLATASCGTSEACALILCAQTLSTETVPEALEEAARSISAANLNTGVGAVPYLSAVTFGPEFTSERLAALEELCAWSGGLSFNVADPGMLQPAAEGLASHLFSEVKTAADGGPGERRRYYAQKQEIGACFMHLPVIVPSRGGSSTPAAGPSSPKSTATKLSPVPNLALDSAVPSEAMLAVLSDVTLAVARRWSRSLRLWRMHRGKRDVVFGEPGSIGLDFEEPQLQEGIQGQGQTTWRLRATHPPASALKMEEGSELVAINQVRVTERTPRSEVARRISARPVSLTFRLPSNEKQVTNGEEVFSMMLSEIVVAELREGLPPLKTSAPPLSTASQRVAAAKTRGRLALQEHQGIRILDSVRAWGLLPSSNIPEWVADLPDNSPVGQRLKTASTMDRFSRDPSLLFRLLMFCGDALTLVRAGKSCCSWQQLLLHSARRTAGSKAAPQRRLWTWVLRWGAGPPPSRRLAFWQWALRDTTEGDNFTGKSVTGREGLLQAAARVDPVSLSRLCSGMGGMSPSVDAAVATVDSIAESIAAASGQKQESLPSEVLDGFLREPLHCQRLWLMSDVALPWLVMQGRHFQVALAAHYPNLFRHLVGEGLAPELFYCKWLQGLFRTCAKAEVLLQLWDIFVFERSFKIFIRFAVAIFGLLEKRMLGTDVEKMMDLLFDIEAWQISSTDLLHAALHTKVTRSMLREIG
eukprot:TRINITY_DN27234_c0_g1_i1.p1 TRINITY_DN27234_c0_g1~~TRINITY_DN27234_c0_g1_i1.p1  ORF type:complete len:900 (-),score=140.09 TRINITY_DN27234_c0_g1_i1:171-2870(-)